MRENTSVASGSDLLILSMKLRCLAEGSRTPISTFFRFVTIFYERGCMRPSGNEDRPYEVDVSMKCADEIIRIFTDNPHSVDKCLYNSFEVAGDTTSRNIRLEEDRVIIEE